MRRSTGHFLTAAACLVFAGYAASFLYFFVDDEAIPLVYARNLLRGRGLVYTVLEGRVEGYSDFLHVLWSAVLLALTHAFGLPLLAPLLIGKLVSVAAAFGVIAVTARTLRSQQVALPGDRVTTVRINADGLRGGALPASGNRDVIVVRLTCGMPPPFSFGGSKTYAKVRRRSPAVRSSA